MNKKFPNIVILTGAGISAESGLATFRGQDGMWENHPIEDVASIQGYFKNPKLVQEFYNMRRRQLRDPNVKPNKGHEAIVRLEREWPGEVLIITQNVDNLHERVGTKNLIHMHGELLKARCLLSSQVLEWNEDILETTTCPCCDQLGVLRPHIVWFGEMPLEMDRIFDSLDKSDLFISIGTSGVVYPAASFVQAVGETTEKIEINMEETNISPAFDHHIKGLASEALPKFVDGLIGRQKI